MKRLLFVAILTAVVLIFQNCSTGKNITISESAEGHQNTKAASDKVVELPLDLKTALSLQINNVRNTKAMSPQDLLVRPDIYYYIVNLADGKIQSFDFNNNKLPNIFCLSEADRMELASILYTGQICKPTEEGLRDYEDQDTVCTMEYVMPYARLHFSGQSSYAFGEKNSGCDISTDLCGDHSVLLRGFVRNLIMKIKTKICN